jgi:plasmid stabilization system protein ParE
MTYAVILRPRAEDDIRTAFQWYESQQPTVGEEFIAHLRRALERIGEFPESSPVAHKAVRRALVTKFRISCSTSRSQRVLSFSRFFTRRAVRQPGHVDRTERPNPVFNRTRRPALFRIRASLAARRLAWSR